MRRFIIILVPVSEPSGCGAILVLLLLIAFLCNGIWEWTGKTLGFIPPTPTVTPWPTDTPTPQPNWKTISTGISGAVWSPDSRKIAFLSDHDVWVMNADGSNKTRLTTIGQKKGWNPWFLTWVSNGTQLAYFPNVAYRETTILGVVSISSDHLDLLQPEWLETHGVDMGWLDASKDGNLLVETTKGIWLINTRGEMLKDVYIPKNFWEIPTKHWVLSDNKLLLTFDSSHQGSSKKGDPTRVQLINLSTLEVFAPPFEEGNVVLLEGISSSRKVSLRDDFAYSANGDMLAKRGATIIVTDERSQKSCEIRTTTSHIAWSPDGTMLMLDIPDGGALSVAAICL